MNERQLIADLLSALEYHTEQTRPIQFSKVAIEAAREYLRKPAQQEPVAMRDAIVVNLVREGINKHRARELADHFIGLATPQPPAQRTRVGLTDEEISAIGSKIFPSTWNIRHVDFARSIEAAHGITKGNT